MIYVIYMDILWFTNVIMDMLLLILLKKLRGLSATIWRIFYAACIGAFGAVLLTCIKMPVIVRVLISDIVVPYLMINIGFHTKNIKSNISNFITLYLISALVAGMIQMIFCHTPLYIDFSHIYTENNSLPVSWSRIIVCICCVSAGLVRLSKKYQKNQMIKKCRVILTIHGKRIDTSALIDTGNGLYEPVSQKPVNVIHYAYFKNYFHQQDVRTMRMIPMKTIGGEERMLIAVRIDALDVYIKRKTNHFSEVYVALNTHRFGTSEVLLHPDMLEGL